ncbi:MAG: amino acid ABC transporter permease [Dongiaceae bacterium]
MSEATTAMTPPAARRRYRLRWPDAVILAVVALLVGYTAHRTAAVLHYRWSWDAIPPFLLRWDEDERRWVTNLLLQGFFTTVRLSLWGIVAAAAIGMLMGLCRVSGSLFLRLLSRFYVELVRNIPPLVFIFIFYFFISSQIMPLLGIDDAMQDASPATLGVVEVLFGAPEQLSAFVSGLICLALFEGAYVTEIVRAGIQSIEKGQWEGGLAVGLTRLGTLRLVILPQAIQRITPPLAGQFISLIKDSSIVSLISIQELTLSASQVAISTTAIFESWITAALLYFALCFGCSLAFRRLERRLALGAAR